MADSFHSKNIILGYSQLVMPNHRMGKEDAKKRHETDKVPLSESAKSSYDKIKSKAPRKASKCSKCGSEEHTARICKMPRKRKRKAVSVAD